MLFRVGALVSVVLLCSCGGGGGSPQPAAPPGALPGAVFSDATVLSGLSAGGVFDEIDFRPIQSSAVTVAGGGCAGDFDGDGWPDLYLVGGSGGRNQLFRNLHDGTFEDVAAAAGVDLAADGRCGPVFVDYDGDGRLDLFMGGVEHTAPVLFRNRGDGTFEDATAAAGLVLTRTNTISAAFGDYDRDGDLDLYLCHWELAGVGASAGEQLWRNKGDGTFEDVSVDCGIADIYNLIPEYTFTPNFADINGDGWPDLLLSADFGTSQVFLNQQDGTFERTTTSVISDENGMGGAVGDYDNDGDIDWFVSSIFDLQLVDPESMADTGNRLYRNKGDGTFEDATAEAGVRKGYWGWGSTFGDFNNDGWLDLFHVNGWFGVSRGQTDDPSVLFMAKGDGTFEESAQESGIDDTDQGRGVVCFDYDRDGDLDIYVANLNEPGRLFRNDTAPVAHYLTVVLKAPAPNSQAVGARIWVTTAAGTQMRELRCGNNFTSANPVEAYFGLGGAARVSELRVRWPDGEVTLLSDVPADQVLIVRHPLLP